MPVGGLYILDRNVKCPSGHGKQIKTSKIHRLNEKLKIIFLKII